MCLQRFRRASLRAGRRSNRHVEIIEDRHQLLQQRLVGELHRVLLLSHGPLLEVLKISGGAKQQIPVFLTLCRQ